MTRRALLRLESKFQKASFFVYDFCRSIAAHIKKSPKGCCQHIRKESKHFQKRQSEMIFETKSFGTSLRLSKHRKEPETELTENVQKSATKSEIFNDNGYTGK